MRATLENSAVATGLKKVSFHSNPRRKANKCTIALISHASKVMLKTLQMRLQQYVNCELPDIQAGFRRGRGTRDQIANIHWITEKVRVPGEKKNVLLLLTIPKPLTVWFTTSHGKFFRRWDTRPPDLPPEKSVCRSRSNS